MTHPACDNTDGRDSRLRSFTLGEPSPIVSPVGDFEAGRIAGIEQVFGFGVLRYIAEVSNFAGWDVFSGILFLQIH